MNPESFHYIRLFYHSIVLSTAILCFLLIFSFWQKHKEKEQSLVDALFFAALIVISWVIPSLGHLLSLVFGSIEVLRSIFRVLSLCNNLFILLFLPYLGYFEGLKQPKNTLKVIITFLLSMMFLFVIDGVSVKNVPIGSLTLLWVDTGLSLFAVYFLGKGMSQYFRQLFPQNPIFSRLTLIAAVLLSVVVLLSFALTQFNLFHLAFVYQYFYLTYIFQYMSIFFFMIAFIILSLEWDKLLSQALPETQAPTFDAQPLAMEIETEILPESLAIDYDEAKQCFVLSLTCNTKVYTWTGENCIYPFFYWVYVSLALKQNLPVPIKDAQVNRNKMLSLFGKELKPKNFLLLNGEEATLTLAAEKIHLNKIVLQHNAVKAKFRDNFKPFLPPTSYDNARYKSDFYYADEVFQAFYANLLNEFS
ncbi:MAG: hypothetical protein ACKVTZ_15050 [Bacteroidia bacterium]